MKHRRKLSERLLDVLVAAGIHVDTHSKAVRLYPGHWQRSAGAWVWCIDSGQVGSQYTMRECVARGVSYHVNSFTHDVDVIPKGI